MLHLTKAVQKKCHWGDPALGLYQTYLGDLCPPNNRLNPDGTCAYAVFGQNNSCDSFCQIRTRFYYGAQQPYLSQGYWDGTGPFTFTAGRSQLYLGDRRLSRDRATVGVLNTGVSSASTYRTPLHITTMVDLSPSLRMDSIN